MMGIASMASPGALRMRIKPASTTMSGANTLTTPRSCASQAVRCAGVARRGKGTTHTGMRCAMARCTPPHSGRSLITSAIRAANSSVAIASMMACKLEPPPETATTSARTVIVTPIARYRGGSACRAYECNQRPHTHNATPAPCSHPCLPH